MRRFVEGVDRVQSTLFPEFLEDWICEDNPGLSKDDLPPPPYSVHHGAAEAASVPRTTVPRKNGCHREGAHDFLLRSRHGHPGKMDTLRGSSARSDGNASTTSLFSENGIFGIC